MVTTPVERLRLGATRYRENLGLAYWAYLRRDPLDRLHSRPGRVDPYSVYECIRARGPLVRARMGWITADYELVSAILRDRRFGVHDTAQVTEDFPLSVLQVNPPDHTRLRRIVAPAFGARQLVGYGKRIDQVVHGLIDGVRDREFDLIDDFASPLPIAVISELLGVPQERTGDFAECGSIIIAALDGVRSQRQARELDRANHTIHTLFAELLDDRRGEPTDDVLGVIVAAENDERVTAGEVMPLCTLLLIAGFETTMGLITNGVQALLAHPEQWRALGQDPSLSEQATEEVLRYDPPVQRTTRVPLEDVELAGQRVARGEQIVLMLGGAGRDPAVFPDPTRFDIRRENAAEHLAFAAGIHFCLGQAVARMEGQSAFAALAQRLPGLHSAGRLRRRRATTIRGPISYPVAP